MYLLKYNKNNNLYQIHGIKEAYEGVFKHVKHMAVSMGVDIKEFDMAWQEMNKKNHKKAFFGLMGTFLYSED